MVGIINTKKNDDISALLTVAFISHTDKVESTRSIVDMWDEVRKTLALRSEIDQISALLATGRIMDLKKEIGSQKFIPTVQELISAIAADMEKRCHFDKISDSQFVSALLTSAYISHTSEIETINSIIDQWEKINNELNLKDGIDLIAAILTTGRIKEEKYQINNIGQILDVYRLIGDMLRKLVGDRTITQKDIAAAFLTNASIEISPKVEKIQNIIELWQKLEKQLIIRDEVDYTVTLLTYGRVRDINVQFFLNDTIISEIKASIRGLINSKLES